MRSVFGWRQASLAEDPEAFDKQLEKALAEWKAAGKKAVWVTIPSRLVGLIPVAAARGFEVPCLPASWARQQGACLPVTGVPAALHVPPVHPGTLVQLATANTCSAKLPVRTSHTVSRSPKQRHTETVARVAVGSSTMPRQGRGR